MALMSSQRSSSFKPSSSETPPRRYDVFLSFRGVDVRDNFVAHLYLALRQMGILTFQDDKLEDGETIKDGLLEAIEESRFSIVVLSKNYADSSWCLNELVRILECKRNNGQDVYPIFYHVEPSEVRKKEGAFGEGFARALSKQKEKASSKKEEVEAEVKRWTEALEEVGNLKGRVYPDARFRTEANLINDLVHKVFYKSIAINHIFLGDLVGISSRMMQVIKLLDLGSEAPRVVVGLWGMGGIGKTTLAKAVYDYVKGQFGGCSFIEDVTEVLNKGGVSALQGHLISDILGEDIKVRSTMDELSIIQNNVCRIKVLIVLDNVSTQKQAEDLAVMLKCFRHGSRIIITTRDEHVLTVCSVHHVFNVRELNEDEAIQLFESKAFVENGKTEAFQTLVDRAVGYAGGVPLALKVFGSFLLARPILEWESALERFKESPGDRVVRVLRISYEGLEWTEKQIFLDIACFFKGQCKDRVINILDSCGFNAVIGISVLVEKSLLIISADNNVLMMHDLVQKMGWSIVDFDEDRRIEPGERIRLWRPCDVRHVLMENTGTENVEGISLCSSENIQLRPDAFVNMTNLRILQIEGTTCSVDLPFWDRIYQRIFGDRYAIHLPNKLRYLHWDKYPFKCMPIAFQPAHLVELRLTNSCIEQLWDRKMELPKLKVLDLRQSRSLTKSPEFTGFPNLKTLAFVGCGALVDLHPSIGKLKKLKILKFTNCSSLQTLPCGIESQRLEDLSFSGCWKLNNNFLENFGDLKQLSKLYLDRVGITELSQLIGNSTNLIFLSCVDCTKLESIPSSIGQLKKLEDLSLENCYSLSELPEEVGLLDNLRRLNVNNSGVGKFPVSCVQLRNLQTLYSMPLELPSFPVFESLTELGITNSCLTSIPESVCFCVSLIILQLEESDFESLPTSIKYLSNLKVLSVENCKSLQELPEVPPNVEIICFDGCDSLKTICSLTVCRDAEEITFSGCPKLVGNEEINVLLGYKFVSDHIKKNNGARKIQYYGPGSKLPKLFNYKNVGDSINFHLPIRDSSICNLLGFVVSLIFATNQEDCTIDVKIQTSGGILYLEEFWFSHVDVEYVAILYCPVQLGTNLIQMSGTVSKVYFEVEPCGGKGKVMECGIRPIYKKLAAVEK